MERALILAPFSASQLDRLRTALDVRHESWLETRRIHDPAALGARLGEEKVSILVVESDFIFDELYEAASALRFVGICRTATSQVDLDEATKRGILVVNTPGRNAEAVAEHALGLMLALARRIPAADRYVKDGRWENPAEPYISMRGVELSGRTLGVIGFGAVGSRLAGICACLGMKVIAHDPYAVADGADMPLLELDEVVAAADFLSVHVPLNHETEGILDARRIALMKPTAYLVNTSESRVADVAALADALRRRAIAGAAFDVFETHPVSPTNPLLGLDNVVLTPHLGGATEETIERHSRMMTDDILRFLDGGRPVHLVNPQVWERRGR